MVKRKENSKLRRGEAFVAEPTGSAPLVNLDGMTEHRSAGEVGKMKAKNGVKH